jgi:hypothetical protein
MEFIMLSLPIATLTELTDLGIVEKILSELVELEEDHLSQDFISKFRNHVRKGLA